MGLCGLCHLEEVRGNLDVISGFREGAVLMGRGRPARQLKASAQVWRVCRSFGAHAEIRISRASAGYHESAHTEGCYPLLKASGRRVMWHCQELQAGQSLERLVWL